MVGIALEVVPGLRDAGAGAARGADHRGRPRRGPQPRGAGRAAIDRCAHAGHRRQPLHRPRSGAGEGARPRSRPTRSRSTPAATASAVRRRPSRGAAADRGRGQARREARARGRRRARARLRETSAGSRRSTGSTSSRSDTRSSPRAICVGMERAVREMKELCRTRCRGLGLALVEVPRFRAALERRGERMLERLFSPAELEYARRKKSGEQNLAARFAAKCAGRAALRRVRGRTLEVARRRSGEPRLRLRATRSRASRSSSSSPSRTTPTLHWPASGSRRRRERGAAASAGLAVPAARDARDRARRDRASGNSAPEH